MWLSEIEDLIIDLSIGSSCHLSGSSDLSRAQPAPIQ